MAIKSKEKNTTLKMAIDFVRRHRYVKPIMDKYGEENVSLSVAQAICIAMEYASQYRDAYERFKKEQEERLK